MTKAIRIFSWIMAGAVLAGSVGSGAYFIVKFVLNKQFDRTNLGPKGEIQSSTNPNKRFHLSWYANENGTQFMTQTEYEKLDEYLSTHLYYGPESNSLQEIIFGDRNVIHSGTAGLYFPTTGQIFINTTYYQNATNIPFEVRRDSIFEVIAHEYGHHFASCYFKNYKASDNFNIPTEEEYTDGYGTIWNKSLLDSFTNIYNLTSNLSTLKSNINPQSDIYGSIYSNISNTASINDLYEYANHKGPYPLTKGSNYYFATDNNLILPVPYFTAGKDDNLDYIYSSDEQIARKFEQAFFPKQFTTINNSISGGIFFMPQKYITKDVPSLWSPFSYDLAHTKQLSRINTSNWWQNELIYPDTIFGGIMSDANNTIVSNSSKVFYSYILKAMGYGTQLAQLFTQNTQKVIGTDSNGYTYLTGKNSSEMNNIKFSGYTDQEFNNMVVVNQNNLIVANLPLITGDYNNPTNPNQAPFNFFAKKDELTQYGSGNDIYDTKGFWKPNDIKPNMINPNKSYYSYIMKDYINYNIFNNCSIYFNNNALPIGSYFSDNNSEKATTIYTGGGKAQLTNYKERQNASYSYARFTLDNNGTINIENNY